MKSITLKLIFALAITYSISSCKKDEIKYKEIPEEIKNTVPDSIIQILVDLGMPINEGKTPPTINGIYLLEPQKLLSSNVSSDIIGNIFVSTKFKYRDQNNSLSQIYFQRKVGTTITSITDDKLSYISGHNNLFTVFSISNSYRIDGIDTTDIQQFLYMCSGIKQSSSPNINTLYTSIISLKEIKNTTDHYLKVGKGRVFYDEDGVSDAQSTFRTSNDNWTPNNNIPDFLIQKNKP